MVSKIFLRLSPKTFVLCAIAVTILLSVYYASYVTDVRHNVSQPNERRAEVIEVIQVEKAESLVEPRVSKYESCPALEAAETDINTVEVFKDFDFQVSNIIFNESPN